jgi:hypothetical protein
MEDMMGGTCNTHGEMGNEIIWPENLIKTS